MAGLLILAVVYIVIFLMDVPPLIRRRAWRELLAFAVLSLMGLALGVPWSLGHKIFFPSEALIKFFEPLARLVMGPQE
ncbi:hypothetical protein [Neomoorella thermoacetica]|uniref:Uncharacterized protein n=3 Tax=Neomoorella thermoacetica TaxID=1525 RepID=A0A1D7XB95_NEOTH|nr:hypothetical protein [Moorella thermoacetica]AKX94245.1 hypothetical protein MOTHE_c14520 [Moorella thermoacetica]AKX96884.1 hypothetical protein MOTHA_c15380 [Moorella thermoacetica]AOQ24192.1 hypothetical protein Maut_01755 [Moorella thermoacetica]APC08671.1 hypothetical protein MTJW_15120 [Moorella thermoacetica]OIQ11395.1 hypothetical protein MOOTH_15970 [Moorella thermoacetica]